WNSKYADLRIARGPQNILREVITREFPDAKFMVVSSDSDNFSLATELFRTVCENRADAALISGSLAYYPRPPTCEGIPLRISDSPKSMIVFGIGASLRKRWAPEAADELRNALDDML